MQLGANSVSAAFAVAGRCLSPLKTWRTTPTRRAATAGSCATPLHPTIRGLLAAHDVLVALEERQALARRAGLSHRTQSCFPQIALAQALTREFQAIIRQRDVDGLYSWLRGVRQSGIKELNSMANGIWRDRQAVEAALTHPESQGQVEGQVNRLKLIKRCGYGRSGFDLLRIRVLLAS